MKSLFQFAAATVLLGSMSGLFAQAPARIPRARPPFAMDNQLIETGGFEMPRVRGKMPKELKEGNFIRSAQGEWIQFASNEAARKGKVESGLTNEIAHSGWQSLYIKFDQTTQRLAAVDLRSALHAVSPGKPYHIGIWGRMDAKRPITLAQRTPNLRLQVDFYQEDRETQCGESVVKVQPIPGSPNRPLMFTSDRWTEFYADLDAPMDARYIQVTWTWTTTVDVGKTDGIVYFDDAVIEGEKPEIVDEPEPPTAEDGTPLPGSAPGTPMKEEAEADADGSEAAPAPAAPKP